MEYDRALYRVYERVLDDLALSAPIIESRISRRQQESSGSGSGSESESESESSNRGTGTFESNSDLNANGNINMNEDGATVENEDGVNVTTDFSNPTAAAFASELSMRNGRSETRTVPFILPLFMHAYSDALMEALSNEGSWRRFWDTLRYHHRYYYHTQINNQTQTNSDHDANSNANSNANANANSRISNILTWINSVRRSGLVQPGQSLSRIDLQQEQTIFRNIENQYDAEDNNLTNRLQYFDADADVDVELDDAEPAIEMTTINASSSGLRRRPPMRIAMTSANNSSENGDRDRHTLSAKT